MDYAGESPGGGPKTRTAWTGAGDGVLFHDAGGDGQITDGREFAATEWYPTARDAGTEPRFGGGRPSSDTCGDEGNKRVAWADSFGVKECAAKKQEGEVPPSLLRPPVPKRGVAFRARKRDFRELERIA